MCGLHFLQWPFFLITWSANVISGTNKPMESLGSIIGKQSDPPRVFMFQTPRRKNLSVASLHFRVF